jgi:uncharacterized protein
MNNQLDPKSTPSFARTEIAYLSGDFSEPVRDPLWKDIGLSPAFKQLLRCEAMQKLGRIKQLGPTFHLYPGAVHTRLSHSLGVFHVARLMLLALLRSWVNGEYDCPFSHVGIQSFLSAAMLHDLGHFPYAHALKELALRDHEQLAAQIIEKDAIIQQILTDEIGASVAYVQAIIDETIPCDNPEIAFYRALLSGTLDPDKLDYLSRDAFFCGVPYGMQDSSYIISRIRYLPPGIPAIPIAAIGAVEHLLFSKYLMYQNVYWHHSTRSATAMIKKALYLAIAEQVIAPEDLYGLDDESFSLLGSTHADFLPFKLLSLVKENSLFPVHAQVRFDKNRAQHRSCLDLADRQILEEELFKMIIRSYPSLQKHEIIIDVPEQVSFEATIPIILSDGSTAPFSEADELFKSSVVEAFTASLRKIRIFAPQSLDGKTVGDAFNSIIGNTDGTIST